MPTTAISPGTRLGPYEIQSLLGAGGMGEVYRARDSRLQRDVAVKVLPGALAADKDRLKRFERTTLRTKHTAGPIAQRKAIQYAKQVARGLAATQKKVIAHQDKKPENR